MTDPVATTLIVTIGSVLTAAIGLVFKKLSGVEEKVDGRYTALETQITAYQTEIIRLQAKDTTTPFGVPSASQPVTLSAGDPQTLPPKAKS